MNQKDSVQEYENQAFGRESIKGGKEKCESLIEELPLFKFFMRSMIMRYTMDGRQVAIFKDLGGKQRSNLRLP